MDCGGTFPPECMDFDHRPGEKKLFGIGQGLRRKLEALLAEIAKCDLVCANCHRIRTHRLRAKPLLTDERQPRTEWRSVEEQRAAKRLP
jgi:hypothetical protein